MAQTQPGQDRAWIIPPRALRDCLGAVQCWPRAPPPQA